MKYTELWGKITTVILYSLFLYGCWYAAAAGAGAYES